MPFRKLLWLSALLLLAAAGGSILHAAEGDIFTLLDDSNLRQGPDSSYASVGVAKEGDQAVEQGAKGNWIQVRISASGDVGWLYADSLERVVSGQVARQQPANASISNIQESNSPDQSMRAPDVTVSSSLDEDVAVIDAPTEPQNKPEQYKPEVAPSMFVDGAVSAESTPVESAPAAIKTAVKQGDVTVSEVLDTQVDSKAVSDLPVSQAVMIKEEPASDEDNVEEPKLAYREKIVAKSKLQNVIETGGIDDKAAMTGEPASLVTRQKMAETSVGDTTQQNLAQTSETSVVVSSKTQQVEVADVLSADSTVAKATGGNEEAPTGTPLRSAAAQEVTVADVKSAPPAMTPVHASGMLQVVKTTTIRTGPGSLYDVLGWVGSGARVETVGRNGDWLKVRMQSGGRTGWIEAAALQAENAAQASTAMPVEAKEQTQAAQAVGNSQLSEAKPISALPVQSPASVKAGETTIKANQVAESTAGNVVRFVKTANLRAGPDGKFDVVAWAGRDAYARVMARKGDWVRVQMQESSRIGWAHKNMLNRTNAGGNLPVATVLSDQVTEAPVSAAVAGAEANKPVYEPAMVMSDPLASQTRKQQQNIKPRQAPAKAAQPEVLAVKPMAQPSVNPVSSAESAKGTTERSLFSFNRKANLRAGPDAKFDVVTWAGVGSYASELARNGDWVRVQMQVSKRIGWVYSHSLELVKAGVALPAVMIASDQVEEKQVEYISSAEKKKIPDGLLTFRQTSNLHAGPGKQYDVITWGGKHESAKVIDERGDWRKVRMTVSGKKGWVPAALLVSAGVDRAAVATPAKPADSIQGGEIYQALRTEPLRSDAIQFSELTDWVSKGEAVALLESRKDWMRVKPQDAEKKTGWIKTKFLKKTGMTSTKVPNNNELRGVDRVVEYQDRISKGETFNFSYAALEQALYRVPIEDIHVRIGKDDLKAIFRKDTYDKSTFEIRLRTGRRHLKGSIKVLGSSTRIFKKKSLLIKLDKESTRWYGRRRIALRSMASDKALMREWMAWKLLAAMGAKVPEVHFTRVSFNHGEKTGLYLSIEWMGGQFLAANHLEANGGFYQPNDASHCGDLNSSENMDLCFDKITPQDGDYSMLSSMAKAVSSASDSEMDTVLAQYFNVESVLNWIAVNALVTNGDTYNKNYWLHYSPGHKKWTVIPWDYNLTFGRVYDPFAAGLVEKPFRIFNDNFQYFFPLDVGASNPLKDKTVRNAKLRARLETKIKHLLGMEPNGPEETFGWFSPTVMQARIGNLAAVVGKDVYKDTFLTYGEEDFTKTYESLIHYVTAHDYYLAAKLQGPYMWQPSPAFDPTIPPVLEPLPKELYGHGYIDVNGQSLHMTDQGWGYFVARLNLDAPLKKKAEFKVNVAGGMTPKYLPPGQSPRRCVQRSWALSTQTPDFATDGSVMVEYIQENSRRTEVPETLHEDLLELWMLDGHHWKPLKTEVNEYANTLSAKGVHLESGHVLRFVACSPF